MSASTLTDLASSLEVLGIAESPHSISSLPAAVAAFAAKRGSISVSGIVGTDFEAVEGAVTEGVRNACAMFPTSEIESLDDQAPTLHRDGLTWSRVGQTP